LWRITKMVIWSLQVAIRGTVSLTAYKTQLKNARHRLNKAPRRRILQMVQPLS
ncbi:IS4 family transposase, partial [Escherichia coli]|nr:IS4 family transposase [Escherichia coli]